VCRRLKTKPDLSGIDPVDATPAVREYGTAGEVTPLPCVRTDRLSGHPPGDDQWMRGSGGGSTKDCRLTVDRNGGEVAANECDQFLRGLRSPPGEFPARPERCVECLSRRPGLEEATVAIRNSKMTWYGPSSRVGVIANPSSCVCSQDGRQRALELLILTSSKGRVQFIEGYIFVYRSIYVGWDHGRLREADKGPEPRCRRGSSWHPRSGRE
jgi:hypothetical protein